jgi:chromosome transmission fidelity protein 18
LATYESAGAQVLASQAPTRYAVRQVLDQELYKTMTARENTARQARFKAGHVLGTPEDFPFDDKENKAKPGPKTKNAGPATRVKRDFFGRIIEARPMQDLDGNAVQGSRQKLVATQDKVWVSYHEGLNNAVRKPISLEEFLRGF